MNGNRIVRKAMSHKHNLMFDDPDKDGEPLFFNRLNKQFRGRKV